MKTKRGKKKGNKKENYLYKKKRHTCENWNNTNLKPVEKKILTKKRRIKKKVRNRNNWSIKNLKKIYIFITH